MSDMIGQKFNRLTVMSRHGTDKKRSILWLCKCDCKKESIVRTCDLRNGKVQSCGCLNREITSKKNRKTDLLGQRFGRLLVIQRSHHNGTGKTIWLCLCDCGNLTNSYRYNLKSGNKKSCGCRSRGNQTHGTIYGIYEKGTDNLVYIGQTIKYDIEQRLKDHKRFCRNDLLKKWLIENESEIKPLIEKVKIENLQMMEAHLIKLITTEYHSLFNIQHNCDS